MAGKKLEELVEWGSSIKPDNQEYTVVMQFLYNALFVPVRGRYKDTIDIMDGTYSNSDIKPLSTDWAQFDSRRIYYAAQISVSELESLYQRLRADRLTGIAEVDSPLAYLIDNSDKEEPNRVFILRASDASDSLEKQRAKEIYHRIQLGAAVQGSGKFSQIMRELPTTVIGKPEVEARYPVLIAVRKQKKGEDQGVLDYLIKGAPQGGSAEGGTSGEGADFKGSVTSSLKGIYTATDKFIQWLNGDFRRFDRARPFYQTLSTDTLSSLKELSQKLGGFRKLAASDGFNSLDLGDITKEAEAMHKDMSNVS
ncbi:hypothetical protein HYX09_02770, partial [Candidatus Woesearchaeota archaeon]|nr:hypothetical protein [Candidatus Woesearchaeota archaeon]